LRDNPVRVAALAGITATRDFPLNNRIAGPAIWAVLRGFVG
jgi:hypothetical protein